MAKQGRNQDWNENITEVMRKDRLHWFGHMERRDGSDWGKHVQYFEVEGKVLFSRPRKRWDEVLRNDLENKGINRQAAHKHMGWQGIIGWQRLTHVIMEPAFKNYKTNFFPS